MVSEPESEKTSTLGSAMSLAVWSWANYSPLLGVAFFIGNKVCVCRRESRVGTRNSGS